MGNRGLDLKIEVVKLVKAGFIARSRDVNVSTADPRLKEDMPCIAVNRIYDSEDKAGFANDYDREIASDGSSSTEIKSGLFSQSCELRVWTENADIRDDLYITLKEILLLAKEELTKMGFGELTIKAGRDENDFQTYSPLFIYWGVINMSALAPFDAFNDTPDGSASEIKEMDSTVKIP